MGSLRALAPAAIRMELPPPKVTRRALSAQISAPEALPAIRDAAQRKREIAVGVADLQPETLAADRRPQDHPQRAAVEARRRKSNGTSVGRLNARRPGSDPVLPTAFGAELAMGKKRRQERGQRAEQIPEVAMGDYAAQSSMGHCGPVPLARAFGFLGRRCPLPG